MASFSVPCPKTAALFSAHPTEQGQLRNHHRSVSLQPDSKPNAALLALQGSNWNQSNALKLHAQLTEVAVEKSSNCAPVPKLKPDEPTKVPSSQNNVPDAESISTFMYQVTDLVKLVDSRDIVELQLKQLDCEILVRKKEALPQTTVPNPVMMMHPAQAMNPAPPPPVQVAPANAGPSPSPPVPATAPSTPAKPKSSHPVLKCPMAGTFYHSPAPGAPPFVKVGDKVQKGQVICIIEAMKLMNEIEADQSGTIVEILVDDAKPVSVDTVSVSLLSSLHAYTLYACNIESTCQISEKKKKSLPFAAPIYN